MKRFFTKITNISIFVLLNIVFGYNVYSYDLNAIHYTTKDGLPHNYINSIYQDSDGFIWISTRNGVCRYDGYNFITYKTTMPDNTFFPRFSQYTFESNDGLIWVFGANLHSYYYDGSKFEAYSEDFVFAYPDNSGNLWFTLDNKLIQMEAKYANIVNDNMGVKSDRLRLICKEKDNKIWVFRKFNYQELIKSSNGFYNTFNIPKNLQNNFIINSINVDSKNNIWLSTVNNGLIKFNSEKEEWNHLISEGANKLSDNHVYSIFESDTNTMWIGTMKGLDVLNVEKNTISDLDKNQPNSEVLSSDAVTCFYKDKRGTMFIGTRFGLYILKEIKFTHYYMTDDKNSSINNNVHGFYEDETDNIWIISTGGLDKIDKNANLVDHFPVDKTRKSWIQASPISMTPDSENNLWLGTWQGGIYKFNVNKGSFQQYVYNYQDQNSLSNNSIMNLFLDSRDNIWIGTWGGGLNLYSKYTNSFIRFINRVSDENSLSDNEVSTIIEDDYGRLWVGTMNGLCMLIDRESKAFKRFNYSQLDNGTISNNQVTSLFAYDNTMWIGTTHGLNQMDLTNFSINRVLMEDGLPSNSIKAIINDDKGNIWVSTNKGLAKLEINSISKEIKRIYTYSTYDGLQDDEFLDRSVYKSKNGNLFFGGTNGYNKFNPDIIKADVITPISVFTKLTVDDIEVSVGDTVYGKVILNKPISKTKSIELSYKHRTFSIEFAGLDYSGPLHVKYKYMLKGFDKNWRVLDSKNRNATYTNINKGEYDFLLLTTNIDNEWETESISLKIKIEPPFWRTTWFLILLYGFIGMIIFMFLEIRIRIIKNQRNRLEEVVKERTSEILDQKNNLEKQQVEIKQQSVRIAEMNVLLKRHNIELEDNIEDLSKARVMQKLLDYKEFKKIFPSEEHCYDYIMELKWKKGFNCIRCGNDDFSIEENNARRCKNCNYKESITSGTIFHHLRFSIEKAIYILIVTSTGRKINISELSRTLELRLKTVWNFHNKVKEEMSLLKSPIKSSEGWVSLIITPTKKNKHKFK